MTIVRDHWGSREGDDQLVTQGVTRTQQRCGKKGLSWECPRPDHRDHLRKTEPNHTRPHAGNIVWLVKTIMRIFGWGVDGGFFVLALAHTQC